MQLFIPVFEIIRNIVDWARLYVSLDGVSPPNSYSFSQYGYGTTTISIPHDYPTLITCLNSGSGIMGRGCQVIVAIYIIAYYDVSFTITATSSRYD